MIMNVMLHCEMMANVQLQAENNRKNRDALNSVPAPGTTCHTDHNSGKLMDLN